MRKMIMEIGHDYIKPTKETHSQAKAWRTGGLRFMLGLLVKEFGKDKVKSDLDIIILQKEKTDLSKLFD